MNDDRTAGDGTVTTLRILVVEDDAVIGALLAALLAEMGHEVCAIEATEADAVVAADRCRPDLMIVDVRLGDGSGISAVHEILRTQPVPHFFVAADVSRLRSVRPGTVIVQKPYGESDIARAIWRTLRVPVAS